MSAPDWVPPLGVVSREAAMCPKRKLAIDDEGWRRSVCGLSGQIPLQIGSDGAGAFAESNVLGQNRAGRQVSINGKIESKRHVHAGISGGRALNALHGD